MLGVIEMRDGNLVIHPKRPKGEDGYKTFSIRVKEELLDKINEIAVQTGHSRNELIGQFLEFAVSHCTIADK